MLTGTGPEAILVPESGYTIYRRETQKIATWDGKSWIIHNQSSSSSHPHAAGNLKNDIQCKTNI